MIGMKGFLISEADRQDTLALIENAGIDALVKGCPLRCAWCSTPEGQSFEVEQAAGCTYGSVMTVEQVMKEVRKDQTFYFHSGGGMTVSGGEALARPEFTPGLLQQARHEGINTAFETSLYASRKTVEMVFQHVNTVFADVKLLDPVQHRKLCGVGNELILDNLLATNDMAGNFHLVVRIPILPGLNDSEDELAEIGRLCTRLKRLDYVQLLPYHRLGTATYQKLGRSYEMGQLQPPTAERMEACRAVVAKYVEQVI